MKEKKEDIFHSSAYGKAQNAGAMGSASTESFENRMKMEKNRQVVKGYGDSQIMNGAYKNGVRAEEYVPPEKREQTKNVGAAKPTMPGGTPAQKTFAPPIKPNFGM